MLHAGKCQIEHLGKPKEEDGFNVGIYFLKNCD